MKLDFRFFCYLNYQMQKVSLRVEDKAATRFIRFDTFRFSEAAKNRKEIIIDSHCITSCKYALGFIEEMILEPKIKRLCINLCSEWVWNHFERHRMSYYWIVCSTHFRFKIRNFWRNTFDCVLRSSTTIESHATGLSSLSKTGNFSWNLCAPSTKSMKRFI